MLIKTTNPVAEISWFADMNDGDTEFLGFRDPSRASTFEHCLQIVKTAERNGFKGILLPAAYDTGQDPLTFAAAALARTQNIRPIIALRMGEVYPPTLARAL